MSGFARRMLAATAALGVVASVTSSTRAAHEPQLVPGDRIDGMTLVSRAHDDRIPSIFPRCDPLILAPGLYHRHCTVARTQRLFIGYGELAATFPALDRAWRRETWTLHVDGHEVRLRAFGTDDRTLYNYPPGAYRNSILREWRVMLLDPTRGRHLIRYVSTGGDGRIDVTFTVTIT
jgi:hypothetical protein